MTDKYADLRAALAAGPTPGPWDYGAYPRQNNESALAICKQNIDAHTKPSSGYFYVVYVGDGRRTALVGHGPDGEANARLIAAANPETIRALLADYDRLRNAAHQMHALYPNVWDRSDGCLVVFPENVERFDAAFEGLRAALAQEHGGRYAT